MRRDTQSNLETVLIGMTVIITILVMIILYMITRLNYG